MKKYKGIIFDLDGTLLDTINDLTDSVNDVMKIYGWKEYDSEACKMMVGNGFRKLIQRALPEEKQKDEMFLDEAVDHSFHGLQCMGNVKEKEFLRNRIQARH